MPKSTKRPAKFEDVNDYTSKPVVLVSVNIDDSGVPSGLLTKIDDLIDIYRGHVGDSLIVSTSGNSIELSRPQDDDERAKTLKRAQQSWDSTNKESIEAAERAKLKVGDELKVAGSATCESITDPSIPCSLSYAHDGDHYKVVDGKITQITPR